MSDNAKQTPVVFSYYATFIRHMAEKTAIIIPKMNPVVQSGHKKSSTEKHIYLKKHIYDMEKKISEEKTTPTVDQAQAKIAEEEARHREVLAALEAELTAAQICEYGVEALL